MSASVIFPRTKGTESSLSVGSLNVTVGADSQTADTPGGELTLAASISIPAGYSYVKIINKGATVPVGGTFGADVSATISSMSNMELPVDPDGMELRSSGKDSVNGEFGLLPAISIDNSNGAAIWWYGVKQ